MDMNSTCYAIVNIAKGGRVQVFSTLFRDAYATLTCKAFDENDDAFRFDPVAIKLLRDMGTERASSHGAELTLVCLPLSKRPGARIIRRPLGDEAVLLLSEFMHEGTLS